MPPEERMLAGTYKGVNIYTYALKYYFAYEGVGYGPFLTYDVACRKIDELIYVPPPPEPTPEPIPEPIPEPTPEPPVKMYQGTYKGIMIYYIYPAGGSTFEYEGKWYEVADYYAATSLIDTLITPVIEPDYLVETYRLYEIWFSPKSSDYYIPKTGVRSGTLELARAAIDGYFAPPPTVWTQEQLNLFLKSGLTHSEILTIPSETTDMIEVEFAVPKLAVLPSPNDIKKKVNDEMIAQGVEGEIVGVVCHLIKSDFFAWYEYQKAWLFIRSPLVVTGAISITAILATVILGLLAATIICWKWSEVRVAETRETIITDINDVIQDVLANPDLTQEQKDTIINQLLDVQAKATEEGKSWLDKILELAPIGLIGIGLLLLLSFMPKRRD